MTSWVNRLKSSGLDVTPLASANDPLVKQVISDTLVQCQGILEDDFSDSPADLMRERVFRDYLDYCRDQRIFDTIDSALGIASDEGIENVEDVEDSLDASGDYSEDYLDARTASQQAQSLLANFSNVSLDEEDDSSDDEDSVDWVDEYSSDDSEGIDEDSVDWGDDSSADDEDTEDVDDISLNGDDEDSVDWADDFNEEDSEGIDTDEDSLDWGDAEDSSDEDSLDWGDDDEPATPTPRTRPASPAPQTPPQTSPNGSLAGVGVRNGSCDYPAPNSLENGSQNAVSHTADVLTSAYDFVAASLRKQKG